MSAKVPSGFFTTSTIASFSWSVNLSQPLRSAILSDVSPVARAGAASRTAVLAGAASGAGAGVATGADCGIG